MRTKTARPIVVCLATFAAWSAFGAGIAFATLSLSIETEGGRTEVLPLLPVCVTIRVTNTGATTTTACPLTPDVPWPRLPRTSTPNQRTSRLATDKYNAPMYVFRIRDTQRKTVQATFADYTLQATIMDAMNSHPSRLRSSIGPGQTWVQDYCLGYGLSSDWTTTHIRSLFDAPGDYAVRLEMPYLAEAGVPSNEIVVRVREPESDSDRKAYDVLRSSPFPHALLGPPGNHGCPFIQEIIFHIEPPVADLAARILAESPNSTYASYARLLWGKALCGALTALAYRKQLTVADAEERAEGFRLLRQSAEDSNLPRRYREAALLGLQGAKDLDSHLRHLARKQVPSVESVLDGAKVDLGPLGPEEVFGIAYQLAVGTEGPVFGQKGFERIFTPEQIEALKVVAVSDPVIPQAAGLTPLQKELEECSEWARQELRKLPWRDPNTGELTLRGIAPSGGLW